MCARACVLGGVEARLQPAMEVLAALHVKTKSTPLLTSNSNVLLVAPHYTLRPPRSTPAAPPRRSATCNALTRSLTTLSIHAERHSTEVELIRTNIRHYLVSLGAHTPRSCIVCTCAFCVCLPPCSCGTRVPSQRTRARSVGSAGFAAPSLTAGKQRKAAAAAARHVDPGAWGGGHSPMQRLQPACSLAPHMPRTCAACNVHPE